MGKKVTLRAPDSKRSPVVSDEADVAFWEDSGYTRETVGQEANRGEEEALEERYGDKGTAAALIGTAQGATGNLFVPLVTSLVGGKDEVAGTIKHNQGIHDAFALGTTALTSLAGVGLLGKGAAATLGRLPTGIISKYSRAGANSTKLGVFGRSVLEGAGEAGLHGIGQGITDVTLRDKPLVEESVASSILSKAGEYALYGGAGGAVAGLASKGASAIGNKTKLFDNVEDLAGLNLRFKERFHLGDDIVNGFSGVPVKKSAGKTVQLRNAPRKAGKLQGPETGKPTTFLGDEAIEIAAREAGVTLPGRVAKKPYQTAPMPGRVAKPIDPLTERLRGLHKRADDLKANYGKAGDTLPMPGRVAKSGDTLPMPGRVAKSGDTLPMKRHGDTLPMPGRAGKSADTLNMRNPRGPQTDVFQPVNDPRIPLTPKKPAGARSEVTLGGKRGALGGDEALIAEAKVARSNFLKNLESDNLDDALSKLGKLDSQEEAMRAANKYEEYIDSARKVALRSGNEAAAKQLDNIGAAIQEQLGEALKKQGVNPSDIKDYLAAGVLSAEIIDQATGLDLTPGGPVAEAIMTLWAAGRMHGYMGKGGKGGGMAQGLMKVMGRRGGGQVASDLVKRGGGSGGAAGIGFVAGRHIAGAAMDRGIGSLISSNFATQGRIAKSVKMLLKATSAKTRRGGTAAAGGRLINNMLFDEPKGKTQSERFLNKLKELRQLSINTDMALTKIRRSTQDLRQINPEMADNALNKAMATIQHLNNVAPHDPGVVNRFGVSRWKPSVGAQIEFLRHVQAAMDPVSVFEDLAAGRLSPQATETVKTLFPAHFAEAQKQIMADPEKLAKLPYSMQVALGGMFDIPTNSFMGIIPSLQTSFNAEQEEKQAGIQAGALDKTSSATTTAQSLSSKSFE
jgi:hypothetical protein